MNSHTKEDAESVKRRLRRIGGQIAGIEKMVDGGRGCMEVLTQISSAIGALQGLWGKIMERHLRVCISSAVLSGDKKLVDELVEYLKKVRP
ncbi:MAG: metal-sensitive transcriptional regulator [Opitutales bacterium]|nr:metal-sensitive transcriptional regulator [Opitutales bacterium]